MPGMLAAGHSDSAAWPAACLAGEPSCVSWGLWMLAALCWIAARSLLSCECPGQGHRQPSVLCLLYTFLGHICNTVGALLASQLGFQILTGTYMAVADVVRFLLTLFPPCPPESHKIAGLPRRRRRRRRLRGGLLALTLPLSVGAGGSLLAPGPWPARGQLRGARRRLLGAVFECRGKPCQRRRLWATLCSAAASVLYAAAIVTHNQQPVHVLRALPWLLIALGSAALDVVLLFITCTANSQMGQRLVPEVPDAWAPLAGDGEEGDRRAVEEEAVNWAPLNMFPKPRSGPRMVATSHCLDLMIRLVQQTGHSVARLPRDAQMGAAGSVPPQPPACPPLPALRTGLSSSSSSDAASVNSELEWDFEDATVQWSQPSPAAQPCSVLCPGTFGQPAAPPRHPKHPSPWLSKQ
ncbi:transmembrane protein 44 isoform X3 [Aquila chrysaetos chrysaetos]|uniref:transmembrane protein 44 isoform X3 n=1 Tax=Aquila chrysaetos chrysaetos TaxID=223781 RepID=UPI001176B2A2|nr:transmembrane protein 44 isoform X3 [Aquila chrysaetos chrysaetos]